MKIVFLLALASGLSGLASCKSILPGGDQAKNVELEYTYVNEFGKTIKVKVQSDLINLSGIREVKEKKPELSFFKVAADLRKPQVQFKPEPLVKTVYVPAPEPQVRYVVVPSVVPRPEVRYILQHDELETEDSDEIKFEVQHPKVRTIYVQAPAPVPVPHVVEFKAPEPQLKYMLPSHFVAATHTSKLFKATPKKSNDDEDSGSAEK